MLIPGFAGTAVFPIYCCFVSYSFFLVVFISNGFLVNPVFDSVLNPEFIIY